MPSFDIVSEIVQHELDNAVLQAQKEVAQRFDFRGTNTEIEKTDDGITLRADSEGRVDGAYKVLQEKVVKRGVSLKSLDAGKIEPSGGGTFRLLIKLKQGIATETAKDIIKLIKDSKIKVQAAIMGDQVRITGKKRDDLQQVIALMKKEDLGLPLQFINFRD